MRRLWKGLRNEYVWLEKVRKISPCALICERRVRFRSPALSDHMCVSVCVRLERSIKSDEEGGKCPGEMEGGGVMDAPAGPADMD